MGLIQAIAATPGLRNIASMGGFGAQERAYMGEIDYGPCWWEDPADLEPEAETPAIFFVCQQTDVLSDKTPVFSQPFASDDENLALSEDGYLINGESQFLLGIHVDEYGRVIADEPKIVHINTKNLKSASTNRIRYRVNLPNFPMTANADFETPGAELLDKSLFARDPSVQGAGTVIGDDRMKFYNQSLAGGSVQVFARDGRSVPLVFRWAKMGSLRTAGRDIWNLFYRIRRDARAREIAWKNAGQNFVFAADGRLEDGHQVAPTLDLNVDGIRMGNATVTFGEGGLTQFTDRAGLVKVLEMNADGCAGGEFSGISMNARGRLSAHYTNGMTRPVADIQFTGDEPWFTDVCASEKPIDNRQVA
jgi:flagellar hook protein FlgE